VAAQIKDFRKDFMARSEVTAIVAAIDVRILCYSGTPAWFFMDDFLLGNTGGL